MPAPATRDPAALDQAAMTAVHDHLERALDTQAKGLESIAPEAGRLVETLREYLSGGKLLRPRFTVWGGVAALPAPPQPAQITALAGVGAAIELVQAAALLHDDVIDHSPTRRGRPAVHVAQAQAHRDFGGIGDAEDFGIAVAIVLGDLALSWAEQLFAEQLDVIEELAGPSAGGAAARCRREFDALRTEMMTGQYLDILHQAGGFASAPSPADAAQQVIRWKTVPYSSLRPLRAGAAAMGADDHLLEQLGEWAMEVGTAFQLRDDLLSIDGDADATGKPVGGDIAEGKRTLILERARAAADEAQRAVLDAAVGNADASPEQIEAAHQVLRDTGAVESVTDDVRTLTGRARDRLSAITPLSALGAGQLQRIADTATSLEGLLG